MSEETPKLTGKQEVFIEEYLSCFNATEAARRAKYEGSYNTLRSIGSENLTKPNISAEIRLRLSERAMCADEVLVRLTAQARGDLSPFIYYKGTSETDDEEEEESTDEGVTFRLKTKAARKNIGLVKKIKIKKRTTIKEDFAIEEIETEIALHDSQAALDKLAKAHGLYGDDVKVIDAVAVERASLYEKLRKYLNENDYVKALEALAKSE